MNFIGNLIWFLCGGFLLGFAWLITGLLWCITIIGIPVGTQCFKIASVAFWPFGKQIVAKDNSISLIFNILWIIFGGIELAATSLILGLLFTITIIGIPFGKQFFKLAKIALLPFGSHIY